MNTRAMNRRTFAKMVAGTAFPSACAVGQDKRDGAENEELRKMIERRRRNGNDKVITALAYTPDSQNLAVASLDGTIRIYDGNGIRILKTITTVGEEVYAVAVSPDGRLLASAGSHSHVQIWELATGSEVQRLKGHQGPVPAIAFSPDGRLLATGGYDKSIRLWNTANWGETRRITGRLDRVTSVAFSMSGRELVSGGATVVKRDLLRLLAFGDPGASLSELASDSLRRLNESANAKRFKN